MSSSRGCVSRVARPASPHGCYAQYKMGNLVWVWELAARQRVFPRIVFSTD